ncbi:Dep Domain-Containing Protein 1B [Manis pentadactyla]|nr:Dep Domain-Containing Protein 1B [Manis pentadactyla]
MKVLPCLVSLASLRCEQCVGPSLIKKASDRLLKAMISKQYWLDQQGQWPKEQQSQVDARNLRLMERKGGGERDSVTDSELLVKMHQSDGFFQHLSGWRQRVGLWRQWLLMEMNTPEGASCP